MDGKNTMVFYHDWIPLLRAFAPDDALKIIFALAKYDQTGIQPTLAFKTPLENAVYLNMVDTVTRNRESYAKKCEKNRNNGLKGGRPKNRTVSEETERLSEKPNGFKSHDNDADADSDSVNDSDTVNDDDVADRTAASAPIMELSSENLDEIIALWNQQEVTQNIKSIPALGRRYENTRLCMKSAGSFEELLEVICSLDDQAWFRKQAEIGNKRAYDWFCDPNNFLKIIEGNYKETYGRSAVEGMVKI